MSRRCAAIVVVDGVERQCEGMIYGRSKRTLCLPHYQRALKGTLALDHKPVGRTRVRRAQKELIGYVGAHVRLYRRFGPAREFDCLCGAQAQHWALVEQPTLVDEHGRTYSLDAADYLPMCARCHVHLDRGIARQRHPSAQ